MLYIYTLDYNVQEHQRGELYILIYFFYIVERRVHVVKSDGVQTFKYVDLKAANIALSASARLKVHKGIHNCRHSQFLYER